MAKIDIFYYSKSFLEGLKKKPFLADVNFISKDVLEHYIIEGFDPITWERTNGNFNKVLINEVHFSKWGKKNDDGKLPYHTVLFKQFPLALKEVIKCSNSGHNKYKETDTDWQNFSRLDNAETRYRNASLRHMTEEGVVEDMLEYGEMTHEGAAIWNLLADLEIKLRKQKQNENNGKTST